MRRKDAQRLYGARKYALGFPDLEPLRLHEIGRRPGRASSVDEVFRCIDRLTTLPPETRSVAVVGCGPRAGDVKELKSMGYDAVGIEPVEAFADAAREHIGEAAAIVAGSAEKLPLETGSQAVVVLASVLEHVDSPSQALAEAHRVLAPGGVAYVQTTNRYRLSLTGNCAEYRIPFFNLFPATLKEAFVHEQLHYRPALANYSSRPAVHWFCYADLCRRGREAGFHRFYSKFDLLQPDDPAVARSRLRRALFDRVRYNPWLRSLALLQYGDSVFMLKRGPRRQ